MTPMTSDSLTISSSWPSILTSVPDHLPNSTRSPAFSSILIRLPFSSRPPGPTPTMSARYLSRGRLRVKQSRGENRRDERQEQRERDLRFHRRRRRLGRGGAGGAAERAGELPGAAAGGGATGYQPVDRRAARLRQDLP